MIIESTSSKVPLVSLLEARDGPVPLGQPIAASFGDARGKRGDTGGRILRARLRPLDFPTQMNVFGWSWYLFVWCFKGKPKDKRCRFMLTYSICIYLSSPFWGVEGCPKQNTSPHARFKLGGLH